VKLILSRKGFDGGNAKAASPICDDDSFCSFPIPDTYVSSGNAIRYSQVLWRGNPIAPVVAGLSRGRIAPDCPAHLDPDLNGPALASRPEGWRPIFGQSGKAETHLENEKVGKGDVFLFFGWFRKAELIHDTYRYVRDAPDLHVIFGWLQIGRIHDIGTPLPADLVWTGYHPHCNFRTPVEPNRIYIAAESLSFDSSLPGGGTFSHYRDELCLTDLNGGNGKRSIWRLPRCFHHLDETKRLSQRRSNSHWNPDGKWVQFNSGGRGQEFVINCDDYGPEICAWLSRIFACATD
jgi:hypothetical protein